MKMHIGNNIKRLRKEKNITQEQLATAMNITCAAVSKWEREETYPDITIIQPLAYYFGVTIDELMGYDQTQITQKIESILSQYSELYRNAPTKARDLIVSAYQEYPNSFEIMSKYMWNLGGDYADNNKSVLISHKEEFLGICEKINNGCTDNRIRMDAIDMQGKLLWAEGKITEALELYRSNFSDWYMTVGQKSEQLFSKDTSEFLYWARKNMYELAGFAADKLVKSYFFDNTVSYAEKVRKSEFYGDIMSDTYDKTGEIFFLVIAESVYGRLSNDLKLRGGIETDTMRIHDKYNRERDRIKKESEACKSLQDMNKKNS